MNAARQLARQTHAHSGHFQIPEWPLVAEAASKLKFLKNGGNR